VTTRLARRRTACAAITLAAGAALLVAACGGRPRPAQPAPEPRPPAGPRAAPDAIFQRPYAGDRPVGNVFDHNTGRLFEDRSGVELGYWGGSFPGSAGHRGYDIGMPIGTPIVAVAAGTVTYAGPGAEEFCPPLNRKVRGNYISIEHTTPTGLVVRSEYAHFDRVDVQVRQHVEAGAQIGLSGNTGCSTGPHLHFGATRVSGNRSGHPAVIDPFGWQGAATDPWAAAPDGAESVWLWKTGEAPALRGEVAYARAGDQPVQLTRWRYWVPGDDRDPNLDWIELTLDPRSPGATDGRYALSRMTLRFESGETLRFPNDLALTRDNPVLLVHVGGGRRTPTDYYIGRTTPPWGGNQGCIRVDYAGTSLHFRYGHNGGAYSYYFDGSANDARVCP